MSKILLMLSVTSALITLAGCSGDAGNGTGVKGAGEAKVNLLTCEKQDFHSCKVNTYGAMYNFIDCLFTNKTEVPVDPGSYTIWNYDEQGILLDKGVPIGSGPVAPGHTIHLDIQTNVKAAKSVVCSMDPEDAAHAGFKSRVISVN